MKSLFEKYKHKEITTPYYSGKLAGFSHDKLIIATTDKPQCSFRRLDEDSFIAEEYKDVSFRYVYCNESSLNLPHPCRN